MNEQIEATEADLGMLLALGDDGNSDAVRPPGAWGVRVLLTLGDDGNSDPDLWPDYAATYGLTAADTDRLIELIRDVPLPAEDTDDPAAWAPMHAWRALGQMREERAVAPLLALFDRHREDLLVVDELPSVFGMIGPPSLPAIERLLAARDVPVDLSHAMVGVYAQVARRHPEARTRCVGGLIDVLDPARDGWTDPLTRAFAISALIQVAAVETMEAIRDAFARDVVDKSIAGDLEEVEIALGLREERATARPRFVQWDSLGTVPRPAVGELEEPGLVADELADPDAPLVQPVRSTPKIGRNAPCPCGSGRKYKKCCLG